MRSVHLILLNGGAHHAVYGPTWNCGAPLIVEFVPDAVSDHEVARMASERAILVGFGQRRVVAYRALDRRSSQR